MIKELLAEKRLTIVNKWTERILKTYPEETFRFLKGDRNRFSNPVGNIIISNADSIYDEIISGSSMEKLRLLLTDIIKIRTVQEFTPSEAIGFVYILKKVLYEELQESVSDKMILNEFYELNECIDRIALMAFDIFMECKEKVHRLRINEIRYNLSKVLDPAYDS